MDEGHCTCNAQSGQAVMARITAGSSSPNGQVAHYLGKDIESDPLGVQGLKVKGGLALQGMCRRMGILGLQRGRETCDQVWRVALGNLQPVEATVLPESVIPGEAQDPAFSALSPLWAAIGECGLQYLGLYCLIRKPLATCGE